MRRFLLFTIICGMGVAGWIACARWRAPSPKSTLYTSRMPYDPQQLQQRLVFFTTRVRQDPRGAIGWAMLSEVYNQRCRETGDMADALSAEHTARQSIALRPSNNTNARNQLTISLLAQHRFREALAVTQDTLRRDRDNSQAQHLSVELQIETGGYELAEKAMTHMAGDKNIASDYALRARLLEINGHPEQALVLLRRSQQEADQNLDMPHESVAWFHVRSGDLLAAMGKDAEAERSYHEALTIFPRSYKALAALARLTSRRKDWTATLEWSQKAADIVPTPDVLALMGDAYAALGRKDEAIRQYALIETIGRLTRAHGVIYDRQRALYCADHSIHLDEALSLARRELSERQDIYTYDTLAWVCYKKGLLHEAKRAMTHATARHTCDVRLLEHSIKIERAVLIGAIR